MAYTPHTWATGETITADKLNNIDQALRRASSGIQAHHLGTQTIAAATQFTVYMDEARYNQGDGFTLSSNDVKCNHAGIVAVSARLYCASGFTAGDQIILSIGKNSDIVEHTSYRMKATGGETIVTKVCLIQVDKGDVIRLKAQNMTGGRGVVGSTAGSHANSLTAHYLA